MAKTPKNKNITTIIYSLEDPDTNEIRYIGKTVKSLPSRLTNHIYTAKKINNHRCNWIKSIVKKGKKPLIKIIDSCDWKESAELEIYWITQFKNWGFNLVNSTEGGEGNLGFKLSKERRDKLTKAVSKKVYQYSLNGNFIKEFPSVIEASRQLNFKSPTKISLAAQGLRGKSAEYQWSFKKLKSMKKYKRGECNGER